MKLTKVIWHDFLETAVDSSGRSGWIWFENKYGFTPDMLEQLILDNQEKSDMFDILMKRGETKIIEENKELGSQVAELKEENRKLLELPRCEHSCDCTDCQIRCLKCSVELRESKLKNQLQQYKSIIDEIGKIDNSLMATNARYYHAKLKPIIEKIKEFKKKQ